VFNYLGIFSSYLRNLSSLLCFFWGERVGLGFELRAFAKEVLYGLSHNFSLHPILIYGEENTEK
jgi:hypothetical protein